MHVRELSPTNESFRTYRKALNTCMLLAFSIHWSSEFDHEVTCSPQAHSTCVHTVRTSQRMHHKPGDEAIHTVRTSQRMHHKMMLYIQCVGTCITCSTQFRNLHILGILKLRTNLEIAYQSRDCVRTHIITIYMYCPLMFAQGISGVASTLSWNRRLDTIAVQYYTTSFVSCQWCMVWQLDTGRVTTYWTCI